MSVEIDISFAKSAKISGGLAVAIGTEAEPVSAAARGLDPADVLDKAVSVAGFKGKAYATVDVLAPKDSPADRIAIVGAGKPEERTEYDWMRIGGKIFTLIRSAKSVTIDLGDGGEADADAVARALSR